MRGNFGRTKSAGYIGEGKYNTVEHRKIYSYWSSMINRCYLNNISDYTKVIYKDIAVCEEWMNFQNFAKWHEDNYYEIDGHIMNLDKDILVKGNKVYSPDTCRYVPHRINTLFINGKRNRGKYPVGVYYDKERNRFRVNININGKHKKLGRFKTPIDAFNKYKEEKEKLIKSVADEFKEYIPSEIYDAMYKWEIMIDD